MENPRYWTDLHYELLEIAHETERNSLELKVMYNKIKSCLEDRNYKVSLEDIESLYLKHEEGIKEHLCGYSFMSKIVNEFCKKDFYE